MFFFTGYDKIRQNIFLIKLIKFSVQQSGVSATIRLLVQEAHLPSFSRSLIRLFNLHMKPFSVSRLNENNALQ